MKKLKNYVRHVVPYQMCVLTSIRKLQSCCILQKQLLAKNQERLDADAARKRESRRLVKEMPAMAKPLSNLECQKRLAKYDAFFADVRTLYDDDEVLRTDEDLFTRMKGSVEHELVVLNLPDTKDNGYIQNIVAQLVASDIVRRRTKKQ